MNPPNSTWARVVLIMVCLTAITGSAVWIYSFQFAKPPVNSALHQEIGRVLADETAKLLGGKGKVVVITLDDPKFRELQVQLNSFEEALRKTGLTIKEIYPLETDGKPKYGVGTGLSARRYVRIVNKNQSADAIVSLVGVPELSDDDIKQLKKTPKFVAETRSADDLEDLFKNKMIHAAIVARFTFPAPVEGKPRNPKAWFDKYFQVVTAETAKTLLGAGD